VLVGINLLREGLDMPEVALVAIFDADKEGFLRSDRSLIQTIGRAARNVEGRAILYADRITGSMRRSIDETDRRRQKQMEHNEKHGITPQGIKKDITDILEGAAVPGSRGRNKKVADKAGKYDAELTGSDVFKHIAQLEERMYQAAKDLEFEAAANIRDQIHRLKAGH